MEFEKEVTPTIMDGEVVRWQGKVSWANKPEISASRNGVLITGAWPVMDEGGVQTIRDTLDLALAEYARLRKR